MTVDDLEEFERRLSDDLQAIAAFFAEVGHHGSALRILGFKVLILSEISEIRNPLPATAAAPPAHAIERGLA